LGNGSKINNSPRKSLEIKYLRESKVKKVPQVNKLKLLRKRTKKGMKLPTMMKRMENL